MLTDGNKLYLPTQRSEEAGVRWSSGIVTDGPLPILLINKNLKSIRYASNTSKLEEPRTRVAEKSETTILSPNISRSPDPVRRT